MKLMTKVAIATLTLFASSTLTLGSGNEPNTISCGVSVEGCFGATYTTTSCCSYTQFCCIQYALDPNNDCCIYGASATCRDSVVQCHPSRCNHSGGGHV